MVRAKLPKELIKKYGISKKAWAVFRGRNAGRKVKKVRRVKKASGRRTAKRQTSKKVTTMARRRYSRKKKGGRRKMGMPSAASLVVGVNFLNEIGLVDVAKNAAGPGANIIEEGATWAQNVKPGDLVDAMIPVAVLYFFRKFAGPGPNILGKWKAW